MVEFRGATLDSRRVKPGMLFVAVKGEKVDGRDFIPQALAAGAAGIVEGRDGLAAAAREYRSSLKAKTIGVTGSAGKTTVKEMIAAFLRQGGFRVHATEGNFNNDLGLPLTILNCPRDADFLVLEMGTNHPGEIAGLVDVAKPDVGAISSIGTAHIEFFGTQDGIADEKGVLFARLPRDGFAVLGADNCRLERLRAMSAAPVVVADPRDETGVRLAAALSTRLPGAHNAANARIAAAVAAGFGVGTEACVAALEDGFALPGDRWRVETVGGVVRVNDCYNANPTAMAASLKTFAAMPCEGRRIAVLGDMLELGERAEELHAEIGRLARSLPLDLVVAVGRLASAIANEMPPGRAEAVPDVPAARKLLEGRLRPGDAVLLKASRSMALENVFRPE